MRIEHLLVDSNVRVHLSGLSSSQHEVCRRALYERLDRGVALVVCA